MPGKLHYADVLLPLPLAKFFTYCLPVRLLKEAEPGKRVVVQFGARKYYTALIIRIHHEKPDHAQLKEILSVLDEYPLVNPLQIEFWTWISDYYMCFPGDVFKAALPSGLKLESESRIVPADVNTDARLNDNENLIIEALRQQHALKIGEAAKLLKTGSVYTVMKSLIEKNMVYVVESMKEKYRPKKETFIRMPDELKKEEGLAAIFENLKKSVKQVQLLMAFIQLSKCMTESPEEISRRQLLEHTGISPSVLKSLLDKKIIESYDKITGRNPVYKQEPVEPNKLNEHQEKALREIGRSFFEMDVVLLHGITSSGKTEIYIHLIREYLKRGKQVLYLLPEIALTAQIINRLRKVFGNTIGIYHSRFSDAERVETWMNVKKKDGYRVILGVRSSVFLPFEDLGLVIVDEEHENTYKQFDPAPRYNARDAAIMLARLHHAKVLLGTATPSLESYFNVLRGKYGLTELMTRFQDMKLPEIVLADIKEARRKKQIRGHFTPTLLDAMDYALAQGEQVILFQNRRGFSPYIECELCGWVPKCDHCDVSLTYHKGIGKLVCHYCGFSQKTSKNCTVCGSSALSTRGFGTEKIEDDVRAVFPAFKTARLDLDTTRSRQAYEKIIDDFENHKIDILIGTQMVSKGLDFEKVSVVGILNADNMLFYPDFRAYERSFQLMSQVSGRAGRKYRQGKVIIQSSDTEHQIIQYVRRNDFHQMLHTQLAERRKFSYPPYFRLISITLKHKDRQMLDKAAEKLAGSLRNVFPGKILGPEYPYINRIQNMFRKTMLVKIAREGSPVKAKQVLADKINDLTADEKYRAVRVVIDVDPM